LREERKELEVNLQSVISKSVIGKSLVAIGFLTVGFLCGLCEYSFATFAVPAFSFQPLALVRARSAAF